MLDSPSDALTATSLTLQTNISSAAWTTSGLKIRGGSATLTDTSSSGTVAAAYTNLLGGNTIAASNSVTFTDYYSAYISDPVAGTNVTLTNKYSFGTQGAVKFGGAISATSATLTPAANTSALTSTGYSLTGSNAQSLVDLAGTWNTSGTPTAIKMNVTDTASNASSLLMDLQIGSATKFKIFKGGIVQSLGGSFQTTLTGTPAAPSFGFVNSGTVIDSGIAAGFGFCDLIGGNGYAARATKARGIEIPLALSYGWADIGVTLPDLSISRAAAGSMNISDNANGKALGIKMLTELTTIAASAYTDTTIQMPAGAIVLGVSVRVTTAITCTSTFTVGDSGNASRFSTAAVSKAANSTDPGTAAGAYYNASALSVRITPDTTPTDATGRVRTTIHYIQITPSTS